jgi:ribosomal protein S6--L-glutamate ligase
MVDPPQIGIIAEERYLSQAQPSGMMAALRARGCRMRLINPQAAFYQMGDDRWLEGLDLIVGRGRSWALLCLLAWAESRGVRTINRKAAIAAVHNKAEMSVMLAAKQLPTPRTFFSRADLLAGAVPSSSYPLILKPIFGDNCRGLVVVRSPQELSDVDWPEPVALAQSYLPNDGYDLKLYGLGDEIWAVRKPSPFNAVKEGAETNAGLIELTPALEELGRQCGRLFGLELFGVDCIQTGEGPMVIEINDFPNYTSVPGADQKLADYVIRRAGEGRAR